jgi:hypothetical protein
VSHINTQNEPELDLDLDRLFLVSWIIYYR